MKTHLHTADVLTFTLTGAEPQCALTLAALHDIRLFHIRALPSGVQAQIAGVDWPRLQALLGDDRWTVKLVKDRTAAHTALPDAVCDSASIDDIMRFYSGRDAQ